MKKQVLSKMAKMVTLCIGAWSVSCVQDEEPAIVVGVPIFEEASGGVEGALCAARAGGSVFQAGMTVDLSFDTGLTIPLELSSQVQDRNPDSTNSGINDGELQVRDLDVSIDIPQAPEIVEEMRRLDPSYVDFNLPLPSDSLGGGTDSQVFFAQIPQITLQRMRDAMSNAGYDDGTLVVVEYTFHFRLYRAANKVGGNGIVRSRGYTFPVHTGFHNLRVCRPTLVTTETEPGNSVTLDMCTPENCFGSEGSKMPFRGSVCGNAQSISVAPFCCQGTTGFSDVGGVPSECGFSL